AGHAAPALQGFEGREALSPVVGLVGEGQQDQLPPLRKVHVPDQAHQLDAQNGGLHESWPRSSTGPFTPRTQTTARPDFPLRSPVSASSRCARSARMASRSSSAVSSVTLERYFRPGKQRCSLSARHASASSRTL